jgi:polysaccharide biosynthesis/export protein
MTSTSIVRTLVLAGTVLSPFAAMAQSRNVAPPPPPTRAAAAKAQAGTQAAPTTPAQAPTRATAPAPAPTGTTGTATTARSTAGTSGRVWNEEEYRLGPGDKLRVEVYREAQLSQSLQVRPDGRITMPLIGELTATGRTAVELRDAIATSLKEYVTNPVVTVIVQEAIAAQVYVIGEVAHPGTQVMQGSLTVLQALAQAGGLKEFADRGDIRILRKGAAGTTQTIGFNYKDAVKGRIEPMHLQPGDTVVVP